MPGYVATTVMLDLYDIQCGKLVDMLELENSLRKIAAESGGLLLGTNVSRNIPNIVATATLKEGLIALHAYPNDSLVLVTISLETSASVEKVIAIIKKTFCPKKVGKGGEHHRGPRRVSAQMELFKT